MKRLGKLFRRSKTLADVNNESKAFQAETEAQVTDLHPSVQLRLKSESVPPFRSALVTDVELNSTCILAIDDFKKQWTEASSDLSPASVGRRLQFLGNVHATLLKHFARQLAVPYPLVQVLLMTIQDKWISFTTQTCFAEVNPFVHSSVGEVLRELHITFSPLLELVEYCVARESSCFLLHSSAISLFEEIIDVFTRSLESLSSSDSEEVVGSFVRLLFHIAHCVYSLAEMCKAHSAYISATAQSFADLTGRLQHLLEVLLCDIYLQKVSEIQYAFFEKDVSLVLKLFHFKAGAPADLFYVLLSFNCILARKSPEAEENLASLVVRFLFPVVITTLRKHKLSLSRESEIETALEKSLLCLQVVRNYTERRPERFARLIQEHSGKLNDLIYYHAWYYLSQRHWSSCLSFAMDQSRLGRLYCLLFDLLCSDDKELPVSIFLTLLELDLVEKCKDAPPVIQTYTLELVTSYLVSTGTSAQAQMLESCVLDLVLSPLFFTGSQQDGPLVERCNEYITSILRVIKERPGGKIVLLKSLCASVRFYKEFPIYLSKTSELISSLTSERDDEMVNALLSTSTAEQLLTTLQDSQDGVPAASVECLKVIAVKLLDISEVAEQVLHTPALLNRLMEDLVRLPHLTEFYIHCVSRLMKFHPEDELFTGFLQALKQAESSSLLRSLLQGLEQALSGNRRTVTECQARLISAGVFDVLLLTLEKDGDLCAVVLSVFRAVLHKSKLSRRNLTKEQLEKMSGLLRAQLSHVSGGGYNEGAIDMLDNLLFIMFDSTELQQPQLFVKLPEFLGLTLDLLIDFPSQQAKIDYLRLVRKATEASVKSNPSLAHVIATQTHAIATLLSGMQRCTDTETVRELSSLFICLATHHLDPLDLAESLRFLNATTREVSGPGQVVLQCLAASCQKSIDTFVGVDEKNKEYEVLDGTSQCAFLFSGKETRFSIVPADAKNSLFTHNKSFSGFAWVKPEANDHFPLQCVFVLLCKDKSASLHVTSSGSLHFMYLSDTHIVYEALTETEKLIFNKWNFVAISYQKGKRLSKRTEFALFINGRRCTFQDAGSLKFPKTMFSELQIGNREGSDCLKGLISYMYFLSQPLELSEVQQLFKLGVSYPGCFQAADVCHEHWHVCKSLDLHSSLVLGVSPRMHDSAGTPLPLTVLSVSEKVPLDPLSKRRLLSTHVQVQCRGVKPVLTTKFISAAHAVGGLVSFLPLLERAKGAYISETLKLFSAFCSVPNTLTHRQVLSGFCELLECVLSEVHFEEAVAIDVIQMVDSLQWSPAAQTRALETLLLRYRVWTRVSWDTQRIILLNLFRLLSSRYREVSTRKRTLRRALDLLAVHFSRLRQHVSSEVLKSRRLEVMELVRNELMDQTLVESEVREILSHLTYETKTSVDNAAAYMWLFRDLFNCHLLSFSEKSRSDTVSTLIYVLRRAAKKLNSQLQAEAIVLLRLVYGLEPEEDVADVRKSRSISVTEFPVTVEDSVVSAFDEILPDRLTTDVYKALLGFLLSVPEDYAGKFLFEELLEEHNGLKHKLLIPCIAKRLQTADLEVISDFALLCYHLAPVYDRDEFPGWLLILLRNMNQQPAEYERRLMELVGVIFSKAALTIRNGCAKLRSLVHTLTVSEAAHSQAMVLRIMSSVCFQLDLELEKTDISGLGQKVFHNIHDLVYILEDALHLTPMLCSQPAYLPLVKQILDLSSRLNLLLSTYPNLTLLPYSVLQRLHHSEVRDQVDWSLQRKREGGMLRVLLKLLLVALHNCPDDKLQLVLHYLHFVLAGGSTEGLMCSSITRANKVQMYQMLSDYVEERLCRVLDGFPETEDDMLYSEKFLLLYVFVECSEQLMERVEKKMDAVPLARFIHSLLKHHKLGHHVNLFITKENAQSRQDYYEFLRTCGDRIRTTGRQFYYRNEPLVASTVVTHYRRSLGSEAAVADLEVERKTFIRKALKLMQSLSSAQDSVDQLYSLLSSPDYQTTLHMYLTVETSMKVGVVDHVLNSLPPPELVDITSTQGMDSAQAVLKDSKKLEHDMRSKVEKRHKDVRTDIEFERAYYRKQLKREMKRLTGLSGLWEESNKIPKFWKLDRTQDGLQRSLFLKPDMSGSAHEEAVNKKYQQADRRKRSFTDSIDDMEEEKKFLRSLSRLPSDVGEEALTALSPVSRMPPEGFMFVEDHRIPCERISVKGSHFGVLEMAKSFLVFRSDGRAKPVSQYFGSALEWTAIKKPCEKLWAYSELQLVFARRFNHQHTAFEFVTDSGKSCLFNCFTADARDEVLQTLCQNSPAKVWTNPYSEFAAEGFTQEWRTGKISNFEYLMKVNQFASRSFNDLNQYPVFPWVLAEYSSPSIDLSNPRNFRDLSLPVGALDPDSEQEAKRRYSHWEHDEVIKPFHYGSHYCTAGIVLHYLVRLEPFTTQAIALQDGHFDVADRLFSSLENAWMGSLKNSGDYKELVPEFFFLPEFLLNLNKYNFGIKQSGESVMDVQLPAWARSVYEFVLLHRVALESRTVSENLSRWFDLIFGCKQQGQEAVKATNVFFYITYENNCKAFFKEDGAKDAVAEGIAEQIAQYGQTPVQLFRDPHPRKAESPRPPTLVQKNALPSMKLMQSLLTGLDEQVASFFVIKSKLLLVTFSGVVKVLKWKGAEVTKDADVRLESVCPKPACAGSESQYALHDGNLYSCGYTDGSFKVHEIDSGRLLVSAWFHSSRVTCLSADNGQLLTAGEDASLALWDIHVKTGDLTRPPLRVLRGHRTAVKQCTLKTDLCMAASVDQTGEALVYSTRRGDVRLRLATTGAEAVCLTDMGWACICTSSGELLVFSTCGVLIWKLDTGTPVVWPQLQTSSTCEHLVASSRKGLVIAQLFQSSPVLEKWRVHEANVKCVRFALGEQCLLALEEDNSLFFIDASLTR